MSAGGFREALSRLRSAARERFGVSAVVRFEWDLSLAWDAPRGVTAGDGWSVSVMVDGREVARAVGCNGASAVDELLRTVEGSAS